MASAKSRTTNLEERLRGLSSHSGVPVPFECYYACEVADSQDVERRLHGAFGDNQINPKREFFRINPGRVHMILEALSLKDVVPATNLWKTKKTWRHCVVPMSVDLFSGFLWSTSRSGQFYISLRMRQ
ncbi:MAG: hypothetical protein CMM46_08935 [Rhodospirillaceae bacterium]|nr:hypothetical protein [Rhodospirillaceae bacterium]